jgi:N6-L-threonylcarbamoyladenine synthase
VYYPELEFCTDNGAMIALAGACASRPGLDQAGRRLCRRPRWPLSELTR